MVSTVHKILIAEDDPTLKDAYVLILQHAGYEVAVAADGREAIAQLIKEKPRLLILDMLMPGMSGIEVLKDPKVQALRGEVKVIAFSNLSDRDTLDQLDELQVDRYLLKSSVVPQELIEHVRQVLAEPPRWTTGANQK